MANANMDISRLEMLEILANMGIELPANTKMPDHALKKRLDRAIAHSQLPLKSTEIDLSLLKSWAAMKSAKTLTSATTTLNFKEATIISEHVRKTGDPNSNPACFINAFMDLRRVIMDMAKNWEQGSRLCVVEDEKGAYGFTMRIVDVVSLPDDIPAFVVLYEHGPGTLFTRPGAFDLLRYPCPGMTPGQDALQIKTVFLGQKLLLKVLRMNAERLSKDANFKPTLRPNEQQTKHELSFLVPISPLSMKDVGSLTIDSGCNICGEHTKSRCSQCQSVQYCGKECQKADWKTHKLMCKSLSGASEKWITAHVSLLNDNLMPGLVPTRMNVLSPLDDLGKVGLNESKKKDKVPANIHGDIPFIVKIQAPPPGSGNQPIMIYDRRRSIEFFVSVFNDRNGFAALEADARKSGFLGQKIYRWAKRTGDMTLSICLHRDPPADQIKW